MVQQVLADMGRAGPVHAYGRQIARIETEKEIRKYVLYARPGGNI